MSYNREWDKGKRRNDDGFYGRSTREWDDDGYAEHAEGKRRKYNDGAYGENSWYSYSGSEQKGWDGADDGARLNCDSLNEHQHRPAGAYKKKHASSEPTPHVIFLGLDIDFTEADLLSFLKGQGCPPDTATIIRERNTGVSKGFGFAQFNSTEDARCFVDPNFPFVSVPPPASHGAFAATTYRTALEAGLPHNGRRVKIDYSQSANLPDKNRRGTFASNDGTRDIGNTQTPVLLFRGLDPLSGTAAIAQAMKTSSGSNDGGKGMKRVILIKDKITMSSWGFAFVEFVDIRSASAVLTSTMSAILHPNGFRISDKAVAASFAHPYSFQLLQGAVPDESSLRSSVNLGGVEDEWIKYWDEGSAVSVMEFKVEEPVEVRADIMKGKRENKKAKALGVSSTSVDEATLLSNSSKPVMLSFGKAGTLSISTTNKSGLAPRFGVSLNGDEDIIIDEGPEENALPTAADFGDAKGSRKVAPMVASRKIVSDISKWNQVKSDSKDLSSSVIVCDSSHLRRLLKAAKAKSGLEPESSFEFSNMQARTCLLCSRQFKSLELLDRHNKESDLHKKNFQDASLQDSARAKAEALRQREGAEQAASKYRDRAFERRLLYNQPDTPAAEQMNPDSTSRRQVEALTAPIPCFSIAPGKDETNIGNKLLKMMGWKEGRGLGVQGTGRVDPIETCLYSSGVGLGASKGTEIGKLAEGQLEYLNLVKESARERYGN